MAAYKPLPAFVDAHWLLIQKVEEEKILQVTVKLPEVRIELLNEATASWLSDRVSKSAQLWNEQRRMISKDSFSNFIIPEMEKEARALLALRSKNWLIMEYGRQLWSKVSVAPYQKKESYNDSGLRVMACWSLRHLSVWDHILIELTCNTCTILLYESDITKLTAVFLGPQVCWRPRKTTVTFVILDSYDEVGDVLYAGSINIWFQTDK